MMVGMSGSADSIQSTAGRAWAIVRVGVLLVGILLWPVGPTADRLVPLVPATVVFVVLFGHIVKDDPIGFLSLAGPVIALGVVGLLFQASERQVATWVAGLWILALFIRGEWLWARWSRYVLRRALPSAQRTFERAFAVPVRSCLRALGLVAGPDGGDRRAQILAARETLSVLKAPDPDWQALQSDWLKLMDDVTAEGKGSSLASDGSTAYRVVALAARQRTLRGRQPEWRGLHPVFAEGDAPHSAE